MKKFLALAVCFASFLAVHAVDSAFYGDLLSALEADSPALRVSMLIDTLERNSAEKCDPNVLKLLQQDWKEIAFNKRYFSRLLTQLDRYPADTTLMDFLLMSADKASSQLKQELLLKVQWNFPAHADFNTADPEKRAELVRIMYIVTGELTVNDQLKQAAGFIDELAMKFPNDPDILSRLTEVNINGCFRTHDTAPGINGYDLLSETDFWKKRLSLNAGKLAAFQSDDPKSGLKIVVAAARMHMPQAAEMFTGLVKKYPQEDFNAVSIDLARVLKQKKLYIPAKDPLANFLGLVAVKNFIPAKRMINRTEKKLKDELTIILKYAQEDYDDVARMIHSGKVQLEDLGTLALNSVINTAHFQKDRELIKLVIKLINDKDFKDANIYNAAGYVAADLNINLSTAEKFIRKAVTKIPELSAFRDSLAWVLFRQGKLAEAENEIMLALKYREANASTAVMMLHAAEIKAALKKFDEAKILLNKAKKIYDPDNPDCADYNLHTEKKLEKLLK